MAVKRVPVGKSIDNSENLDRRDEVVGFAELFNEARRHVAQHPIGFKEVESSVGSSKVSCRLRFESRCGSTTLEEFPDGLDVPDRPPLQQGNGILQTAISDAEEETVSG
jgi:hypothetical protein